MRHLSGSFKEADEFINHDLCAFWPATNMGAQANEKFYFALVKVRRRAWV
jgi:hypothetical protein